MAYTTLPESKKEQKILDTFGRIYYDTLKQLDLFGASLKTSEDTLHWDLMKFTEAFQIWVTQSSAESLQRRKLARHMREKDCSSLPSERNVWPTATSSMTTGAGTQAREDGMNLQTAVKTWLTPTASETEQNLEKFWKRMEKYPNGTTMPSLSNQVKIWTTPVATDFNRTTQYQQGGTALSMMVNFWPTAIASNFKSAKTKKDLKNSRPLQEAVEKWSTPLATDAKISGTSLSRILRNTIDLPTQIYLQNGRQDRENSSTNGRVQEQLLPNMPLVCSVATAKSILRAFSKGKLNKLPLMALPAQLNPAWVAELMGTTLGKTFYVPMETVSLNKQQS